MELDTGELTFMVWERSRIILSPLGLASAMSGSVLLSFFFLFSIMIDRFESKVVGRFFALARVSQLIPLKHHQISSLDYLTSFHTKYYYKV